MKIHGSAQPLATCFVSLHARVQFLLLPSNNYCHDNKINAKMVSE